MNVQFFILTHEWGPEDPFLWLPYALIKQMGKWTFASGELWVKQKEYCPDIKYKYPSQTSELPTM